MIPVTFAKKKLQSFSFLTANKISKFQNNIMHIYLSIKIKHPKILEGLYKVRRGKFHGLYRRVKGL